MLNLLFNIWAVFWLVFIYLCLYPFILICIYVPKLKKYGLKLTNLWADIWFFIIGMPVSIEYRYTPKTDKQYIFVANHFSLLDVAVGMKVVRNWFSYMGKSSVQNVPLIGNMFKSLHIPVNRSDRNSRARSLEKSHEALAEGRSLFIMPEGGIISKNIPEMNTPFKDGAFSLAIENQIPIVPITLVNLYKIMPSVMLHWAIPKVVIHEKIETIGLGKNDIENLKAKVFSIIQTEINKNI